MTQRFACLLPNPKVVYPILVKDDNISKLEGLLEHRLLDLTRLMILVVDALIKIKKYKFRLAKRKSE